MYVMLGGRWNTTLVSSLYYSPFHTNVLYVQQTLVYIVYIIIISIMYTPKLIHSFAAFFPSLRRFRYDPMHTSYYVGI